MMYYIIIYIIIYLISVVFLSSILKPIQTQDDLQSPTPFRTLNVTLLSHSRVTEDGLQTRAHLYVRDEEYLSYAPPVDHAGVQQIRLMYKLM